jgi:WD40 repeat protein
MLPHSSFQTAGANPGPRTVSLDLPRLFKHPLRVGDLESGETAKMLQGQTDWVTAVAVTPDGQRAVSASADGTLRVWNLQSGEYSAGFTAEGPISRFVIALDGRTIIANEKSGRGHFLRLDGVD